jgi:hypothetical protein
MEESTERAPPTPTATVMVNVDNEFHRESVNPLAMEELTKRAPPTPTTTAMVYVDKESHRECVNPLAMEESMERAPPIPCCNALLCCCRRCAGDTIVFASAIQCGWTPYRHATIHSHLVIRTRFGCSMSPKNLKECSSI